MQYFRLLSFLVFTIWSAQAFALDDVDRFAKKCDFYTEVGFGADSLAAIKKNRNQLHLAKVPIQMSFANCEAIKYVIKLKNDSSVSLESAYPTNADPDVKGSRYEWDSASPSPQFWYFTYGGWEDAGWMLIDKTDGRKIGSSTECAYPLIKVKSNLIAVICNGAYENTVPSLYFVDVKKSSEVWSKPVEIPQCNENSSFVSRKFEFINRTTLKLEGDCRLSAVLGNSIALGEKWVKVKAIIQISEDGLKVKSNGEVRLVDWHSAN